MRWYQIEPSMISYCALSNARETCREDVCTYVHANEVQQPDEGKHSERKKKLHETKGSSAKETSRRMCVCKIWHTRRRN